MTSPGQGAAQYASSVRASIKVPRSEVLEASSSSASIHSGIATEAFKADVRKKFDVVSAGSGCDIAISTNDFMNGGGVDMHQAHGLDVERHVEVVVSGASDVIVEQAKVGVMVALDELNGLHTEVCEIDHKLHNIIGGRKRSLIQSVQEETATTIYIPTPFPGLSAAGSSPAIFARQNAIFITGESFGVQRARDMLYQVSMHKSKGIISRNTAVLPRKIDWLQNERLEELRSIMIDNATFIHMPPLGSQTSMITVYGDSRVSIERSIRSVMQVACQYFVASIWLLPISFDGISAPVTLTHAQVNAALHAVNANSSADVAFKGNCFEVQGVEAQVRTAITLLLDFDALKTFNLEIRFQIELANEHREFISGKKNGKINKIMKQGVRIKFETFNDYNFLIDVSSNDRAGTINGMTLLLEELPAETSFHIPENYHKRIIGVGGKNIQKTMKKFGVYVKFYSKQDLDVETYPFLDTEDNVIARTPSKNAINLDNLKAAVMELVSPKDKDFVAENVPVARRYHRSLLGHKGSYIHEIEAKLGCIIRFPPPESANDLVSIFGPESQIHLAAQMLLDHVPFEAEFRAPESQELRVLLESQDFAGLVERVQRELNIRIAPLDTKVTTPTTESEIHGKLSPSASDIVFRLYLNRSGTDILPAAKDALEEFLVSRNIQVYRSPERARTDSFASSFQHFANKLISVPQAAESTDSFQTDSNARYTRQGMAMHGSQHSQHFDNSDSLRLRAAASSPEIKALFDSPNVASGPFMPHNMPFPNQLGVQHNNSTNNLPVAIGKTANNNVYTSPYQDALRMATGLGGRSVWSALTRFSKPSQNVRSSQATVAETPAHPSQTPPVESAAAPSSIAFPQHPSPLSDEMANMTFSQGGMANANYEDAMATLRKNRAFANRAQSLDIGALAAQQVVQQSALHNISAAPGTLGHAGTATGSTGSVADAPSHSPTASSYSPSITSSQRPFGAIGSKPNLNGSAGNLHRSHASNSFSDSSSQQGHFNGSGNGSQPNLHGTSMHASHHSLPPSYGLIPHLQQGAGTANVPSQQQHHHHQQQQQHMHNYYSTVGNGTANTMHPSHQPSASISRLAPSFMQGGPEPDTANEVLRSLEQLHFRSAA
jgi:hypothetical protein